MRRLIVNADDYGRAPSVSAGIRQAHQRGIVTSTTAMLNIPGVEADLRRALADCPRLGLGVHLTLTAGQPVLPREQVPTLAGDDGNFLRLAQFTAREAPPNPDEVRAEWQAQIEKFSAVTGRRPDHLDSHHHVSFFSPALFRVMLDLAIEHTSAIRFPRLDPVKMPELIGGLGPDQLAALIGSLQAELASRAIRPPCPDRFEPGFYGANISREALLEIAAGLPEGVTELMCHPGLPDEGLAEVTSYSDKRSAELEVLTDPQVRAQLDAHGIQLVTFLDLGA